MLANTTLRDVALSFRARGVLAYLLSQPPGYRVNSADLTRAGSEGRDSIRTALAELEKAGYLRRSQARNPDGSFTADSVVYEHPQPPGPDDGNPGPGATSTDTAKALVGPEPENPAPDNQAAIKKLTPKELEELEYERTRGKGSDYRFEDFWLTYPTRQGKKVGKRQARDEWLKMTYAEKGLAFRGARNMARAGEEYPPDAHRWLKRKTWEDWQAAPVGPAVRGAPARKPWDQYTEDEFRKIYRTLTDMEKVEAEDARKRAAMEHRAPHLTVVPDAG